MQEVLHEKQDEPFLDERLISSCGMGNWLGRRTCLEAGRRSSSPTTWRQLAPLRPFVDSFRLYAWTIADMVDEEKAAAWLKWDFVERTLELSRQSAPGWQR